jgi:hypothetical protein
MDVLSKGSGDTPETASLDAPEAEGGPPGAPSQAQVAVAGDVMSALQNNDTDSFADALASFVSLSQ